MNPAACRPRAPYRSRVALCVDNVCPVRRGSVRWAPIAALRCPAVRAFGFLCLPVRITRRRRREPRSCRSCAARRRPSASRPSQVGRPAASTTRVVEALTLFSDDWAQHKLSMCRTQGLLACAAGPGPSASPGQLGSPLLRRPLTSRELEGPSWTTCMTRLHVPSRRACGVAGRAVVVGGVASGRGALKEGAHMGDSYSQHDDTTTPRLRNQHSLCARIPGPTQSAGSAARAVGAFVPGTWQAGALGPHETHMSCAEALAKLRACGRPTWGTRSGRTAPPRSPR